MSDTSPLEAVFKAYRHDDLDVVKAKLALLDGMPAQGVRESLTLLALQERRANVLEFCLARGGHPSDAFRTEADSVDAERDPETFNVLEKSPFRSMYPRVRPKKCSGNCGAPPGAAATFDIGGRLPVNW